MESLSRRNSKRINRGILGSKLKQIILEDEVLVNSGSLTTRSQMKYFSSESIQPKTPQMSEAYKEVSGEYFEVDSEVQEVAFQHKPGLNKGDLSDSGVYPLSDDSEEKEIDFEDLIGENLLLQMQYFYQH